MPSVLPSPQSTLGLLPADGTGNCSLHLCLAGGEMFDLKTKVMVGIGSGLLIAAFVLIGIVIGLYIKVSKALR